MQLSFYSQFDQLEFQHHKCDTLPPFLVFCHDFFYLGSFPFRKHEAQEWTNFVPDLFLQCTYDSKILFIQICALSFLTEKCLQKIAFELNLSKTEKLCHF